MTSLSDKSRRNTNRKYKVIPELHILEALEIFMNPHLLENEDMTESSESFEYMPLVGDEIPDSESF